MNVYTTNNHGMLVRLRTAFSRHLSLVYVVILAGGMALGWAIFDAFAGGLLMGLALLMAFVAYDFKRDLIAMYSYRLEGGKDGDQEIN